MNESVKEVEAFPIPLGPMIRRWADDGTLRNRLRAVLAEALEAESGRRVLVDSIMDHQIKSAVNGLFAAVHGGF